MPRVKLHWCSVNRYVEFQFVRLAIVLIPRLLQDTHVPREGRDLIRKTMEDRDVPFTVRIKPRIQTIPLTVLLTSQTTCFFQLMEVQAQHAFIRDNSSKGRWDAALTRSLFGMMMELFDRCVVRDLGPRSTSRSKVEHVC
jgi:carboxymethylenebutenolidase